MIDVASVVAAHNHRVKRLVLAESRPHHDYAAQIRKELSFTDDMFFECYLVESFDRLLNDPGGLYALREDLRACADGTRDRMLYVVGNEHAGEMVRVLKSAMSEMQVICRGSFAQQTPISPAAPTVIIADTDFRLYRRDGLMSMVNDMPTMTGPYLLLTYRGGVHGFDTPTAAHPTRCAQELASARERYRTSRIFLLPSTDRPLTGGARQFTSVEAEIKSIDGEIAAFRKFAEKLDFAGQNVLARPVVIVDDRISSILTPH
jgi:hypothetical protein